MTMPHITVKAAETPDDISGVRGVFEDYLAYIEDYLGASLGFQGTQKEFATFPHIYDALFLGRVNGAPVAACGVKPFKDDICELKRLYCRPAGRGYGFGRALTEAAIERAQTLGYRQMYLDTDAGLIHANLIYEALGFVDIPQYYENPLGCSRYMALNLNPR